MLQNEDALSLILSRLGLTAGVSTEAAMCGGAWAVNTSGGHTGTFHLVESGDCWLHLEGSAPRRLHPGDFVLFPRDAGHFLTPEEHIPEGVAVNEAPPIQAGVPVTRMLCGYIEFRSRAAWPLLDSLPDAFVIDLADSAVGDTRNLLNLLISEAFADHPGRSAVIDHLIHVLVVFALRQHIESGACVGLMAALADPRLGRALSGFHAAPERRWSVDLLAAEASMSRAAFAAAFKASAGESPMAYVTGWRMQMAIDLLTRTDDSMAQIAEAVGYESEAAFRNAFRKVVGQPPGQVRRSRSAALTDS
ncbi:MAG: AraC family transcriptional regulator [Pseudomonadales bacterium]